MFTINNNQNEQPGLPDNAMNISYQKSMARTLPPGLIIKQLRASGMNLGNIYKYLILYDL